MRDLAAEPLREAAETKAALPRREIALAHKNSDVLIVTIYDNPLPDVYLFVPTIRLSSRVREGLRFGFKFPTFSK